MMIYVMRIKFYMRPGIGNQMQKLSVVPLVSCP